HRARHRRRADCRRHGAALPHRRDGRRAARGGGHVHHLLVLAGLGAVRDRRARPRPRAVREAAVLRQPAAALRRGDRPSQWPPPLLADATATTWPCPSTTGPPLLPGLIAAENCM